jgi:hypothetical protein
LRLSSPLDDIEVSTSSLGSQYPPLPPAGRVPGTPTGLAGSSPGVLDSLVPTLYSHKSAESGITSGSASAVLTEVSVATEDAWAASRLAIAARKKQIVLSGKKKRFAVFCDRGVRVGLAKGKLVRSWTLTESDQAVFECLDFGKAFDNYRHELRRRYPDFQYIVVEHYQGPVWLMWPDGHAEALEDHQTVVPGTFRRRNWHVISCGRDWLDIRVLESLWQRFYKSSTSGLRMLCDSRPGAGHVDMERSIERAVGYMSSYVVSLGGDGSEKFSRSWHSQGWVFQGWAGHTRAVRRESGRYPTKRELVSLALLPVLERERAIATDGFPSSEFLASIAVRPRARDRERALNGWLGPCYKRHDREVKARLEAERKQGWERRSVGLSEFVLSVGSSPGVTLAFPPLIPLLGGATGNRSGTRKRGR